MKKIFWIAILLFFMAPSVVFADAYGDTDTYGLKWYRFDWTTTAPEDGVTGYGLPGWTSTGVTPTWADIYDANGGTSGYGVFTTSIAIEGRIYKVEFDPKGLPGTTSPADGTIYVISAVTDVPVVVGTTPYPVSGVIPVSYGASGTTVLVFYGGTTNTVTVPDVAGTSVFNLAPVTSTSTASLTIYNADRDGVAASPFAAEGAVTIYYVANDYSGKVGGTDAKVYQFNYTTDNNGDFSGYSSVPVNGWIYRVIVDPDSQGGYDLWDFYLYDSFGVDILELVGVNGPGPTQSWSIPSAATAFAVPRLNDGLLNLVVDQADGGVSPVQKQGKVRVYYKSNL